MPEKVDCLLLHALKTGTRIVSMHQHASHGGQAGTACKMLTNISMPALQGNQSQIGYSEGLQGMAKNICPPVGGSTFLTNMKMAFSGLTLIRFRMTYTNWPMVSSEGTRYLHRVNCEELILQRRKSHANNVQLTHFFLSISGMSLFSAFSTMTCKKRTRYLR